MFKKFREWLSGEPPVALRFSPIVVHFAGQPYTIRPMRESDIDAALMIEQTIYGNPPWNRLAFLMELRRVYNTLYLVVEGEAGVVAFIGCYLTKEEAHITNLAVLPQVGRQGIATHLMLLIQDRALDFGSAQMTLEVRTTNLPAIALYHRLGYQDGALKPGYYISTGDDARDMFLPLDN